MVNVIGYVKALVSLFCMHLYVLACQVCHQYEGLEIVFAELDITNNNSSFCREMRSRK